MVTLDRSSNNGFFRFLLPSIAGIAAFLVPVKYEGTYTIGIGILNSLLMGQLEPVLPTMVLAILVLSGTASCVFTLGNDGMVEAHQALGRLFRVSPIWLLLRLAAVVLGVLIYLQVGPEVVWGEQTGHIVFYELTLAIVTIFVVAAFLLPLLTDYGLMDLVGTFLSPVFRRMFTLPGRSAIDALASWFSAAAVGILITSQQYERGTYSAREACVIATNFSVVSLPFCLLVATVLRLEDVFFQYYLAVAVTGVIIAMILPRVPPLSRIPDDYVTGTLSPANDTSDGYKSRIKRAYANALATAAVSPGPKIYLQRSIVNLLDIWFSLVPGVIVVGLLGLIIAEYTPFANWLSWPFVSVLEWLHLPEAQLAAPTLIVGFADMFLPAAMGSSIDSELTRFVIAGVSVSQLIYMSEVGILILRLPIPLGLGDMVMIFLLRTAIALPLFVIAGRLLGFE